MHIGSISPNTSRRDDGGFTLVEIVMVLVILGILGAVVLPKFVDMRQSAQEKVCEHNRNTILSEVNTREALGRYAKDEKVFDSSSQSAAANSAQAVLYSLFPSGQACPASGLVSVRAVQHGKDDYTFTVSCSIHAPGSWVVTPGDGSALVNWFQTAFHDEQNLSGYKSLSELFSKGQNAEIDSGAADVSSTIAATVTAAMNAAGVDASGVIWRISRENWGYGKCTDGKKCTGRIDIRIADPKDAENADKTKVNEITVTRYSITVTYDADGVATFQTTQTTETSPLSWKTFSGKSYWVLRKLP